MFALLAEKITAFHDTQNFIIAFRSSLSQINPYYTLAFYLN